MVTEDHYLVLHVEFSYSETTYITCWVWSKGLADNVSLARSN